MKASIDIDREFLSQQNGTLTLPLSVKVTGQWKLMARVWVATRLLYIAARLLNIDVKADAKCARCSGIGTVPCEGCDGRYGSCAGCNGTGVRICDCDSYAKRWQAKFEGPHVP